MMTRQLLILPEHVHGNVENKSCEETEEAEEEKEDDVEKRLSVGDVHGKTGRSLSIAAYAWGRRRSAVAQNQQ